MSLIGWVLVVVFVAGILLGAYALMAPRRRAEPSRALQRDEDRSDSGWPESAGTEFASLSESARCEMIFAVSGLEGERAQRLLEHALDDPSEAVALAAAHALASRGGSAVVDEYLAAHPGERADRIAGTLALLSPES
jgi:hypothetical protein